MWISWHRAAPHIILSSKREPSSWKCTYMQGALRHCVESALQMYIAQLQIAQLIWKLCWKCQKHRCGSLNGICTHLPSGSGLTHSLLGFKFKSPLLPKQNSKPLLIFPSVSSSFSSSQMIFAHPGSLTLSLLPPGSRDLLTRTSTPRFLFTSPHPLQPSVAAPRARSDNLSVRSEETAPPVLCSFCTEFQCPKLSAD